MSLRRNILLWFLLGAAALQAGCTVPVDHKRSVMLAEPPREKVRASLATERLKVSDVLQFRLPDDSTATLNGTYQIAPDGTIEISGGGKIQVAGKTVEEAQRAISEALAATDTAHQAIELVRYDYFVVTVKADGVQGVTHVPLAGKLTVKDALAGAPELSKKIIWIARPMPGQSNKDHVLMIDWEGICHGDSTTNYPLQAGDFLLVADEPAKGTGRLFGAVTSMMTPSHQATATDAGTTTKVVDKRVER